jgi:hypothetical protein
LASQVMPSLGENCARYGIVRNCYPVE